MGELGFWIPSLQILLTFYFWNVVPILIFIFVILYFILERFNVSAKRSAFATVGTPTLLVGIFFIIADVIHLEFRYLREAFMAMGIVLLFFIVPTIVSYLYYKAIKKGVIYALVVVISIGLFFFFYPKKMVYEANKAESIFYISDSILRMNQKEYEPHRFVTRQSCSCLGISEEKYLAADYSPYCYGMTINCQEVTFDACEWVLPGLMCPNSENSEGEL